MKYTRLPYMYISFFTYYISYDDTACNKRKNNRIVRNLLRERKRLKHVAR